ncbi:MAG TPA: single-stranded-DNA-specific exonuclease RecJ [Bacillota bacterium]|nr:single-stranded-DNA-specific exonuclease RecJ [Bacillota bacterium]HPT86665.1 single-stranded-DNA-specific exonuclease RecJ [Bacillota bacterium]
MVKKIWKVASEISDNARQLADHLGVSPLIAQLLINRGITDVLQAERFLTPALNQLYDPYLLPDMKKAVSRIRQAIANEETVLIYGDYDVDGITSTSLMIRILNKYFPGRLLYYIPKRLEEGYGLHLTSLEKAIAKGVSLVITVDCGISARDEAAFLKEKGIDLIITDHHEPQGILPDAYAIIDPKISDSGYPFTQLAGVGVAFKVLQGLSNQLPEIQNDLFANLDLVAFGTVADIVPLLDENRVLVKYGLEQLNQTNNIGLRALIEVAGLRGREINSGHIGYILAPRINAAGRMGNSSIGVKLFLSKDPLHALDYARSLEKENTNRQEIEMAVLEEAQAQIEANPDWKSEHALVLAGEGWHLGVIGIVASKLVDLYHKPVILIGMDGDEGRGSGRSIDGFNLFDAIESCSEYLIRFGGHEFAAGLSVKREMLPSFQKAFLELAKCRLTPADLQPVLKIESVIDLSHATLDLARELTRLAPCGPSNPTPVLGCKSISLVDYRSVGENGRHLKVKVSDSRIIREGIGFNLGAIYEQLAVAQEVDVAFSLEENVWNGMSSVQLNLKDLRVAGEQIKQVS